MSIVNSPHSPASRVAMAEPRGSYERGLHRRAGPRSREGAWYAAVYLLALAAYALVAWPHTHPPYMDAFYYVDMARAVAHGQGLAEHFVWNYLGGMPPIPHPGSEYWLPAMSLLLAPALAVGAGYHGVALLTCAIAALCPLLAALIGRDLFGTWRQALLMAAFTLFNGIWFHDWTTPDAFVLYAVLVTLGLWLAYRGLQGRGSGRGAVSFALAGAVSGLAALTRQEGIFLLLAVLLGAAITPAARRRLWPWGIAGAIVLFGAVEAPWLLHNMTVLGAPLASDGGKTLWMRSYESFYALHTEALTPRSYLAWGWTHLVGARLNGLLFELATWLALWHVVLAPPLLYGIWRLRRRVEVRPFLVYWTMVALAMPLLFAVTLRNGTLGHTSGALVPFASAFVVEGLDALGAALGRLRGRDGRRLARHLSLIGVALSLLVSLWMAGRTFPVRGDEYTRDAGVVVWLHAHNPPEAPVMVVDPPAFAYLDERGAYVVAPSDGLDAVRAVAHRYGARYWALDPIHSSTQEALYRAGRVSVPWLRRVAVVDGVQIYRFLDQHPPFLRSR